MALIRAWARMSADGLAMPALNHLGINMRVVILERTLARRPKQVHGNHMATAVFVNFCRLTDKALLEYEAARADFEKYLSGAGSPVPYLRGIDHLENCIDAAYRAARHAEALRSLRIGRGVPLPTKLQRDALKQVRDAVQHVEERLLKRSTGRNRPHINQGQAFALFPTNTRVIIGEHALGYRQLASVITKCHRMIEKIRGAPTAAPTTKPPGRASGGTVAVNIFTDPPEGSSFTISQYFREVLQLSITHA
jgi:hypothetical protein